MLGMTWEWWIVLIVGLIAAVYVWVYRYADAEPTAEDDFWSEADIEQRIREGRMP